MPVDYENNRGEVSNEVSLPVSAPIIHSVDRMRGFVNETYTFTANVSGTRPLSYQWDFGGGAVPNLVTGSWELVTAEVTLADTPGDYTALLTVTNQYGETSFPFTLTVETPTDSWVHTWTNSQENGYATAAGVVTDADGNVYVAGTSVDGYNTIGVLLLKFNANGEVIFSKAYGGPGGEEARGIAMDAEGYLYIAGDWYSYEGPRHQGSVVLKLDTDGNLIWAKSFWRTEDAWWTRDIAVDAEANSYIVGARKDPVLSDPWDIFIVKMDTNGGIVFSEMWDTAGDSHFPQRIKVDSLGSVFVVGSRSVEFSTSREDEILCFDSDGTFLWGKTTGEGYATTLLFTEDELLITNRHVNGGEFLITFTKEGLLLSSVFMSLFGGEIGVSAVAQRQGGRIDLVGYRSDGPEDRYWQITHVVFTEGWSIGTAAFLEGSSFLGVQTSLPRVSSTPDGAAVIVGTSEQEPAIWTDLEVVVTDLTLTSEDLNGSPSALPIQQSPTDITAFDIDGIVDGETGILSVIVSRNSM